MKHLCWILLDDINYGKAPKEVIRPYIELYMTIQASCEDGKKRGVGKHNASRKNSDKAK
jgi:hypothetical protein